VKRFRTVKHRILASLRTFKEIVPQQLNDVAGDVGYTLRFYPETIELGQKIVEALRAEGIGCGMRGRSTVPDWHIYSYMFAIVEKSGATPDNCPYECPLYRKKGGNIKYGRGDCPVADDLFERCIVVGLNQWYTARDCRNIAAGIDKVLAAYCTPAAGAARWL